MTSVQLLNFFYLYILKREENFKKRSSLEINGSMSQSATKQLECVHQKWRPTGFLWDFASSRYESDDEYTQDAVRLPRLLSTETHCISYFLK